MICVQEYSEQNGEGEMMEVMGQWHSVFNMVTAIMNRQTQYHQDHHSLLKGDDILTTISDYAGATMSILTLVKRFAYTPGTLMAFSGSLLWHGINEVKRARGCLAYYWCPRLMLWAGVFPLGFMWYKHLYIVSQEIG